MATVECLQQSFSLFFLIPSLLKELLSTSIPIGGVRYTKHDLDLATMVFAFALRVFWLAAESTRLKNSLPLVGNQTSPWPQQIRTARPHNGLESVSNPEPGDPDMQSSGWGF